MSIAVFPCCPPLQVSWWESHKRGRASVFWHPNSSPDSLTFVQVFLDSRIRFMRKVSPNLHNITMTGCHSHSHFRKRSAGMKNIPKIASRLLFSKLLCRKTKFGLGSPLYKPRMLSPTSIFSVAFDDKKQSRPLGNLVPYLVLNAYDTDILSGSLTVSFGLFCNTFCYKLLWR